MYPSSKMSFPPERPKPLKIKTLCSDRRKLKVYDLSLFNFKRENLMSPLGPSPQVPPVKLIVNLGGLRSSIIDVLYIWLVFIKSMK